MHWHLVHIDFIWHLDFSLFTFGYTLHLREPITNALFCVRVILCQVVKALPPIWLILLDVTYWTTVQFVGLAHKNQAGWELYIRPVGMELTARILALFLEKRQMESIGAPWLLMQLVKYLLVLGQSQVNHKYCLKFQRCSHKISFYSFIRQINISILPVSII